MYSYNKVAILKVFKVFQQEYLKPFQTHCGWEEFVLKRVIFPPADINLVTLQG